MRVHEVIGQLCITLQVAPHLHSVIDHLLFRTRAVLLQDFTRVGIGKDRLDPRRNITRIKRDRSGRRDRCQQSVPDSIGADGIAHIAIHRTHRS